jgi:hypothetical protein
MKQTNTYNISVENLKGSYHFVDLDIAGRIILKWILKKKYVRV